MALAVMAGLWPLRLRSLHAGFWAGERVIESKIKLPNCPKENTSVPAAIFLKDIVLTTAPNPFTHSSLTSAPDRQMHIKLENWRPMRYF